MKVSKSKLVFIMSIFGKRLKAERELKKASDPKWTQGYVAKLIGVARPTYTGYENGTKEPPRETINKIADAFNCSIDYLEGRTNNKSVIEKASEHDIPVELVDILNEMDKEVTLNGVVLSNNDRQLLKDVVTKIFNSSKPD